MSAGRDPFSRRVVVDKGLDQKIEPGQAAVDDQGLVGQVTHVQVLSSEITLITDKDQAVPVEVLRNGLRAIAFGHGQDNMLELAFMPINMDIQMGDQLVTSGIDGVYPRGIPVAVVSQIERSGGLSFAKII
jgi:rod shape-determining protein MreC